MIENIVRKEIKEQLPQLVPQVVKEVMSNMILESRTSTPNHTISNSEKRRNLQEGHRSEEFDDYPTMGNRPKTTADLSHMVSWDDGAPGQGLFATPQESQYNDLITVDAAMSNSENANPIPIRPEQIPEPVLKAMNRNYSGMLERLNIGKK